MSDDESLILELFNEANRRTRVREGLAMYSIASQVNDLVRLATLLEKKIDGVGLTEAETTEFADIKKRQSNIEDIRRGL